MAFRIKSLYNYIIFLIYITFIKVFNCSIERNQGISIIDISNDRNYLIKFDFCLFESNIAQDTLIITSEIYIIFNYIRFLNNQGRVFLISDSGIVENEVIIENHVCKWTFSEGCMNLLKKTV